MQTTFSLHIYCIYLFIFVVVLYHIISGAEAPNKKWGGLTFMGYNCVHVSTPARGVWRHAPPGNFLHIRSSEVHSDALREEQQ